MSMMVDVTEMKKYEFHQHKSHVSTNNTNTNKTSHIVDI